MTAYLWGGLIVLISAVSAIIVPFITYFTTLTTFGIAHVAIELRYIDSRFHPRLGRKMEAQLVKLLIVIALLRCCVIWGWMEIGIAQILELGCGVGLVLVATHHLQHHNQRLATIGMVVGCLLSLGIVIDPIATSITFAIIHNLTPAGFILERQQSSDVRRTLWMCVSIFGLIPLVIVVYQLFPIVHLPYIDSNTSYLSAFIAPAWQQSTIAYPLFSAVTFLQCMHYAVVIGLFAKWTPDHGVAGSPESFTLLPWVPSKYFYWGLGAISVCFLIAFQHSFGLTRSLYGIVASIHAWLEIPLLLWLAHEWNNKPQV
jgi:hypothetical protein